MEATSNNDTGNDFRPWNALTNPVWIGALFLLVVNDHILKHTALAGVVTGKLSDFAGLVVAPVLLASLLRLRDRRQIWFAGAATAAVFAAINVSMSAAGAWDEAMSLIIPWHTTVDPTDLIALFAVPLGLRFFESDMRRDAPRPTVRTAQFVLATFGALSCMATSMEPECDVNADCAAGQICQSGEWCRDWPAQCGEHNDCEAGELCTDGTCEYFGVCTPSTGCGSGEVCRDDLREFSSVCAPDGTPMGNTQLDGMMIDEYGQFVLMTPVQSVGQPHEVDIDATKTAPLP